MQLNNPPPQQTQEPSQEIKFFSEQKKIYPKSVTGRYRQLKWLVMAITLAIYYLAPFIRWDRGPNAPSQAILIDMPSRRAYWFFIEIWPQEVYYFTAILIFSAILLFFITSLFGRVWCGYFCPQTVWTDLFVKVEHLIQGDRAARMRLDSAPLSFEKIWKKTLTHLLWILIGLATAGAFVFYFNDAPTLWKQLFAGQASPVILGFMAGLTFSTYLMAGYAREQVCTYMCPYARFQSAMFDKDTLIIGYDKDRGEPRGKHRKGESWDGRGHCISCMACVQVCPMGIDIREGLQMECIACGLCVDACNEIMDKVELPRGLIRYDTERNIDNRHTGKAARLRLLRPRTLYYSFVLLVVASLALHSMLNRKPTELHVLHDRNPLFVLLSNGTVRNGYDVKILNKTHDERTYSLQAKGLKESSLEITGLPGATADSVTVPADTVGHFHMFLTAPSQDSGQKDVHFVLTDKRSEDQDTYQSVFVSHGE